jgi:hypothetical protein
MWKLFTRTPKRDPEIRGAFNFLLQGTVADLIKQVQFRLDEFFRENEMESRTILNIHDGLYLSVFPHKNIPSSRRRCERRWRRLNLSGKSEPTRMSYQSFRLTFRSRQRSRFSRAPFTVSPMTPVLRDGAFPVYLDLRATVARYRNISRTLTGNSEASVPSHEVPSGKSQISRSRSS